MLAVRVVNKYHRELERSGLRHRLKSDDACSSLLTSADDILKSVAVSGVQRIYQVAAVIDDYLAIVLKHMIDMSVVLFLGRPVPCVNLDARIYKCRSNIVLCGQRVRSGHEQLSAAGSDHLAQIGSLRLKMDGQCHSLAREGLSPLKFFFKPAKQRTITLNPFYLSRTRRSQRDVPDLSIH